MTFFAARYGFMAAALGIPAFIGPWPLAPMLFGFAAVYVAENVVLLRGCRECWAARGPSAPQTYVRA
jgi:hypothetical protein